MFELLPQDLKDGQKHLTDGVQAAVEAAFAEHPWNVASAAKPFACPLQIAPKVQCCHHGGGHHLRITHLALRIFVMIKRFQHVVAQTINGNNLIVHRSSPVVNMDYRNNWGQALDLQMPRAALAQ